MTDRQTNTQQIVAVAADSLTPITSGARLAVQTMPLQTPELTRLEKILTVYEDAKEGIVALGYAIKNPDKPYGGWKRSAEAKKLIWDKDMNYGTSDKYTDTIFAGVFGAVFSILPAVIIDAAMPGSMLLVACGVIGAGAGSGALLQRCVLHKGKRAQDKVYTARLARLTREGQVNNPNLKVMRLRFKAEKAALPELERDLSAQVLAAWRRLPAEDVALRQAFRDACERHEKGGLYLVPVLRAAESVPVLPVKQTA